MRALTVHESVHRKNDRSLEMRAGPSIAIRARSILPSPFFYPSLSLAASLTIGPLELPGSNAAYRCGGAL